MAETGVTVALSYVLGWVALWRMPAGGQVSLEMVPVLLFARLRGPGAACLAGAVVGLLKLQQETFTYHPLQVALDYPLAFAAPGLAGIFPPGSKGDLWGVLVGWSARLTCHVIAGALFLELFLEGAPPPSNPLVYSLAYNAAYLVPTLLVTLPLVLVLSRRLRSLL